MCLTSDCDEGGDDDDSNGENDGDDSEGENDGEGGGDDGEGDDDSDVEGGGGGDSEGGGDDGEGCDDCDEDDCDDVVSLQVSALDQEVIEVNTDMKEMLKLLVSGSVACVCVCERETVCV